MDLMKITDDLFVDAETFEFYNPAGEKMIPAIGAGELVDALRQRDDLTSGQLANAIGVDERQVRRWRAREDAPQPIARRALVALWMANGTGRVVREAAQGIGGPLAVPSAENPYILAILLAPMLDASDGAPNEADHVTRMKVNRARKIAVLIDEGAAASRTLREQRERELTPPAPVARNVLGPRITGRKEPPAS